jgi:hypothetical protein
MTKKVKIYNKEFDNIYTGMFIQLKHKSTFWNSATIINRRIRSIDREKKKILCDDNIEYNFSQLL